MMKRRLLLTTALVSVAAGARAALNDDVNNPSVVSPLTGLNTTFTNLNVNANGPPGTVVGLAAGSITSSSIQLTWSAGSGGTATSWTVTKRTPTGSGSYVSAAGSFTATGGTVTGLVASSSYDFQVVATNASGSSAPATLTNVSTTGAGAVPMPSAANRPSFSGSTLSWSGPVGGGASNGDYTPQTQVLTTSGPVTTSSANQIIQNLHITGGDPGVQVNHNGVLIRRCYMVNTLNVDETHGVFITAGITGTVIEDCFFNGNNSSSEGNGVSGDNFAVSSCTIRRCHFHLCAQAIHYTLNNVNFTENYCDQWSGGDSDFFEVYPVGGSCNNLLVQYNYFTGPDNAVHGGDSGINLSTSAGLPNGKIGPNVVIDTNWFVRTDSGQQDAWQYHSIVNDTRGGAGERLEFTFTNNGIYNVMGTPAYNTSILFGAPSSGATQNGGGLVHDSGNYVMSNPTSLTGTLYQGGKGAGRL